MQQQTKTHSITHLHYHYYYPNHLLTSPNKDSNETLSRSVIYERKRQDSFQFTPQNQKTKLQRKGCQTAISQKCSKMRMSQIINNKSKDYQQYPQQFINFKARSVVEQQLQQNEQQKQSNKNTLLTELEKSKITILGRESQQNSLLAFYEQELRKYRSQIERLKMIQEECVYLRQTFYSHYEERCNKND